MTFHPTLPVVCYGFETDGYFVTQTDVYSRKIVGQPMVHNSGITSISYDVSGKWIAVSAREDLVRVWDQKRGRLALPPIKHPNGMWVGSVAFSKDGELLVTTDYGAPSDAAFVWSMKSGQLIMGPLKDPVGIATASFTDDNRFIDLITADNYLLRWPVRLSKTRSFTEAYLSFLEEISPFSWNNNVLQPRPPSDRQTLEAALRRVDADANGLRTWLLDVDQNLQPVSPVSVQTKADFCEVQKRRLGKLKEEKERMAMSSYLRDLGCPSE